MSRALDRFHRDLKAQVRFRRLDLARARQETAREEAIRRNLLRQQERHEQEVRRRRIAGKFGAFDFGLERMRALVEQALEGSAARLRVCLEHETEAQDALKGATQREAAASRLLTRRKGKERETAAHNEQKLMDEMTLITRSHRASGSGGAS